MPKRKHPHPSTYPPGWIDITETAAILGIQYQRARDAILTGKCGPQKKVGVTRLVMRVNVQTFKKQMNAPADVASKLKMVQ